MSNFLRNYVFGGCYFFTLVTWRRVNYFQTDIQKQLVLSRIKLVQIKSQFELMAYCILPDHIHLLLQLPEDIRSFSYQIREIKRLVTVDLKKQSGQRSQKIWQDRFWEHTIRDEKDLESHFDYIHYNPVKHGYVDDAFAWKWSSYPDLVSNGYYQDDQLGLVSSAIVVSSFGE